MSVIVASIACGRPAQPPIGTNVGTINGPAQVGSENQQYNNYYLAARWRDASAETRNRLVDQLRKLPPKRFRIITGPDVDARRIAENLSDDLKSANWTAADKAPLTSQRAPELVKGLTFLVKNLHWGMDIVPGHITDAQANRDVGPSLNALAQWCRDAILHGRVTVASEDDKNYPVDVVIFFGAPPDPELPTNASQ